MIDNRGGATRWRRRDRRAPIAVAATQKEITKEAIQSDRARMANDARAQAIAIARNFTRKYKGDLPVPPNPLHVPRHFQRRI